MNEFEEIYGEEFFVIDSYNLKSVKQRFYGYNFQNNVIIYKNNFDGELNGIGAYVFVKVTDEDIVIMQDYTGSYELYLYKYGDYFAISNSFIKLVEHLKSQNKIITLNKKICDLFLFVSLYTYGYDQTAINEIELIPRNYNIKINKKMGSLNYEEIDFQEHTIPLDSKEGIELLDDWYYKWVDILRLLKSKTNYLEVDLSGGVDSRVLAAIWLTANIDLDKINIVSYFDNVHTEDYNIASKIADYFNFELNKSNRPSISHFKDLNTVLNISFYLKFGFHKEMFFKDFYYDEPLFTFSGLGGEIMRTAFDRPENYYQGPLNTIKSYSNEMVDSAKEVIFYTLEQVKNKFNITEDAWLSKKTYMENGHRHHCGKDLVENYFANVIKLVPMMDWTLQKLILTTEECDDEDLLTALIFQRYCPDLLKFEFFSHFKSKEINKETIDLAIELNKKYPFIKKNYTFISGPPLNNERINKTSGEFVKASEVFDLLRNAFESRSFEMEFKKYYSSEIYQTILDYTNNPKSRHQLRHVYAALFSLKMIHDTNYRSIDYSADSGHWLKSFLKGEPRNEMSPNISKLLLKYATARIDMKNLGSEKNSLKISEINDIRSKIMYPNWFKSAEGEGVIIQSNLCELDFKIRCINEGKLKIILRGIDFRDKNSNRFPIFIDYTKFTVNDEDCLNGNKLTWHDRPFVFEKEVFDGEIIHVHLEWLPFNDSSLYIENG